MRPLWNKLTPREKEIAGWMREGMTYRQIGLVLKCAEQTVRTHAAHIHQKIGADCRAHCVAVLMQEEHAAQMAQLRDQQVAAH